MLSACFSSRLHRQSSGWRHSTRTCACLHSCLSLTRLGSFLGILYLYIYCAALCGHSISFISHRKVSIYYSSSLMILLRPSYEFIRRWNWIAEEDGTRSVKAYKTALSAMGQPQDAAQAEAIARMHYLVGDFFREISDNMASMELFKKALTWQEVCPFSFYHFASFFFFPTCHTYTHVLTDAHTVSHARGLLRPNGNAAPHCKGPCRDPRRPVFHCKALGDVR